MLQLADMNALSCRHRFRHVGGELPTWGDARELIFRGVEGLLLGNPALGDKAPRVRADRTRTRGA